jgi:hypothetical protein
MRARLPLLLLAIGVALAARGQALPWELTLADGATRRGELDLVAPAGAVTAVVEDGRPHLAVRAAPGQTVVVELGRAQPLPLRPGHFYRVATELRRPPRMRVGLATDEAAAGLVQNYNQFLPPMDFQVAPVWEPIVGFLLVPAGPAGRALRLTVGNAPDGLAEAAVGVRALQVLDLGPPRPLSVPQVIGTWERQELTEPLVALPYVTHSGGSGLYRARATVRAPAAGKLDVILSMGYDAKHHWWRSTEFIAHVPVVAGEQTIELLFPVADRRFTHQFLRFAHPVTTPPLELRDICLEQLSREPAAAATAGQQTPPQR